MAARKDHSYFRSQIPWPVLKAYLEDKRNEAIGAIQAAKTTEQLWEARGMLLTIKRMENLPEALILKAEQEEET